MADQVYLDYNASAPLCPEARQAMIAAMDVAGNPSSVHASGRAARKIVDHARRTIADLVGGDSERIIFTSGGTEANNLALNGLEDVTVFTSAIEHPSVIEGRVDAKRIPVDGNGVVDLDALEAMLKEASAAGQKVLVSVMLANNETGVIQPVAKVALLAREYGAKVHCDAIQALGRLPVDMGRLLVDMVSVSAHKIGGPKGIGALAIAPGVMLVPQIRGGGQEKYRRGGTENVLGIAGFGAAAERAGAQLANMANVAALRDRLETELASEAPELLIAGKGTERLVNTSCLILPGMPGETQVMALDLAGVAISSGSACSSGKVRESHVLKEMGVSDAGSAIRVSLGLETTDEDIDTFIRVWSRMRGNAARKKARHAA
ncbi:MULTISPECIES: cysteine desulfurase family protein [Thalassospira]|jgi:cysteine desulfurase|uniref:cysteine desulfurase family protein n=1 Tax=Thalassospira TaxID=168934 RepID=UPI0007AD73DD|nr:MULTISPECIES: cysteine desulfurase family protein [Thalassospira]KZB62608.1 cysteine desulfurase [Thalassospira sp. MCCC 1A02491]MAL39235.1 cysteine desulfurase [Thalassospira sp.]MCC4242554.1 cysteine desulfurase [Thalassospira povalilytica]URK19098.1 cysteine desulfurase [Thalassospira sp. GO-4]